MSNREVSCFERQSYIREVNYERQDLVPIKDK